MIDEFRKRLGKWTAPFWLLCGLVAFGIFVAAGKRFTPEVVQVPTDWVTWALDAALLLLCVLGGPLAMVGALLLFFVVGGGSAHLFDWLTLIAIRNARILAC